MQVIVEFAAKFGPDLELVEGKRRLKDHPKTSKDNLSEEPMVSTNNFPATKPVEK